jgi:hypothetical protein
MYYVIAQELLPTMTRDGLFGSNQYAVIVSELRTIMSSLGIESIKAPPPIFTNTACYGIDDVAMAVKEYIEKSLDTELNRMYLMNCLVNTAIAKKYTQNSISVIITGAKDEDEVNKYADLFKKGNFTVAMDEKFDVSKENALKIFNSFKKKLNK